MEAGLNASLELQCRETIDIRTKHVRAGFEADLESLRLWEIGTKQYERKVLFLDLKTQEKAGAEKWTSAVFIMIWF